MRPSSTSTCRAWRTVTRVTPYASASARWPGSRPPAGNSPPVIRPRRSFEIETYFALRDDWGMRELLVERCADGCKPILYLAWGGTGKHLAHEAGPDDDPDRVSGAFRCLGGVRDAEPEHNRPIGEALEPGGESPGTGRQRGTLTRGAHDADRVDEAAAVLG